MDIQNIPWEAISAKLNNSAGPDELEQIQTWLALSADHPVILTEILDIWTLTKSSPDYYQPDMGYNWVKLMHRINATQQKKTRMYPFYRVAAAAAIIFMVFLAGISFQVFRTARPVAITYSKIIAPKGNKTQVVLPDSSKVWLNSGSEISYPSDYSATNRELWMKGECYFRVVKDPDHPMLVHGSNVTVKVLGTKFNFKDADGIENTEITLLKGSVNVMNIQNQPIGNLLPGQQLVYANGVGSIHNVDNLEALTSWINNILIFRNQPFEEVIQHLNAWYGVNITLDKSLYYKHYYTFKVKTESLREVLELISIITPIDYQIEGDQIKIKYKPKIKLP